MSLSKLLKGSLAAIALFVNGCGNNPIHYYSCDEHNLPITRKDYMIRANCNRSWLSNEEPKQSKRTDVYLIIDNRLIVDEKKWDDRAYSYPTKISPKGMPNVICEGNVFYEEDGQLYMNPTKCFIRDGFFTVSVTPDRDLLHEVEFDYVDYRGRR